MSEFLLTFSQNFKLKHMFTPKSNTHAAREREMDLAMAKSAQQICQVIANPQSGTIYLRDYF